MIDTHILQTLGKTPISAASPCGEAVTYDPAVDAIQTEFNKLTVASASGTPIDWPRVVALCVEILSHKAKDFTIACRLGVALPHTQGVAGLGLGARVLGDLVATFWNDMHPSVKRARRRLNAYTWWTEQATAFVDNLGAQDHPVGDIQSAAQALRDLDARFREKIADAPRLHDLVMRLEKRMPVETARESPASSGQDPAASGSVLRRLAGKLISIPPAYTETDQSCASHDPPSNAAPDIGAISPPAQSHDEADTMLREGLDRLLRLSDLYLTLMPQSPLPYRLRRVGIWLNVDGPPPARGGETMIAAPDPDRLEALDRLVSTQDVAGALPQIESLVQERIFWLDSSYLCARMLEKLGERYDKALKAVETATLAFVKRLPRIETLCFSGGMPFAAPRTRAWLDALDSPGNNTKSDDTAPADRVLQTIAEARSQATGGNLQAGIATLSSALRAAPDGKTRFRLHGALAGLLIEGRQFAQARLQGNEIVRLIDKFDLTDWNPAQAIDGLTTVLPCLPLPDKDPLSSNCDPLRDKVHTLLGRIDPNRLSARQPVTD